MKTYPHYPKPTETKASLLTTLLKKHHSWLDKLYYKSYEMKMGRVKMPGLDLYVVNDIEVVHRILVEEVKKFPKSQILEHELKPLLGESIITTNGEKWRGQRGLLNPSFEMVRVSNVFGLMSDAVVDMMKRLSDHPNGMEFDIDKEMTFTAADIIFRTILSKKLSVDESNTLIHAFKEFQDETAKTVIFKMFKIPDMFFHKKEKKRLAAGGRIRNVLGKIIQPRYTSMKEGEVDNHRDILASILSMKDEKGEFAFSFEEILDQISMLFLAGHETTASSLTWAIYLLALYPDAQERAYKEIENAYEKAESFQSDMQQRLPYLTNIYREALRLYPPISFFARQTIEETTVRDKVLKKGATLVIAPWLIHRHKNYWDDAHMFDPDRFSDPDRFNKAAYLPFGKGPRTCIGAGFAMQESVLILASLLRVYRIELRPGFIPDIVGRITVRSLNGLPVKLIHRDTNES